MKLVIEDQSHKEIIYQIGLFTVILNQIEYIISSICSFDEKDKRTLGDKIYFLEKIENSYLLPHWRDEIILELKNINEKRIMFIHGISFVDPHKTEKSEIEYKKINKIIAASEVIESIELTKKILEKLLCIKIFYTSKDSDVVLEAFESHVFGNLPFTFYPASEERGFC